MHGQDRNACVYGVDVAVCEVHRDRAAAALINAAELAGLPDDACLVEDAADARHQLCRCVRRAGLAACAGVLDEGKAAVCARVVALFGNLRIVRVEGVAYIGGQADRVLEALVEQHILCAAQVRHEGIKGMGLHAGHAVRADLLLVHEQADAGMLGRFDEVEQGGSSRVGADAVIMAVGADKRAVKADVAGVVRRYAAQLCGQEIRLGHAVFAVQVLHDGELDLLAALLVHGLARDRADEDIQTLTLDDLGRLFAHLISRQMGEKVGDDELRVARLVADAHLDALDLALVADADNAAQLERNGGPLVLLDAAVVVGLEKGHAVVLVERHSADVDARRVQMCGGQTDALCEALRADHGEHDALVAVDAVNLVTGLEGIVARPCAKALGLCHACDLLHGVALGLSLVEEGLVALGIGLDALLIRVGQTVKAGLFAIKKLFGSHSSFSFAKNPNYFMRV